ncbi:MAG: leucine-rich repeat protein [Lachnospiraceae bacterium]|nr:leucine-rich repeat protein [Lachnospiraceae bacterium]
MSSDEAAVASLDDTEDNTEVVVEEFTYINPLYEGIIDESDLNQPRELEDVPSVASDDVEYLDTVEEAAVIVREAMVNRQETIVVYYQMETYDSSIAKSIVSAALEHTGVADEGDYISANYGGSSYLISRSLSGGIYYLTITCTMTYYTTAAQETEVTEKLETVMEGLDLDSKSDYEKISAIYEYICKNVTYDNTNLEDETYMLKYSAYAALINGTSVCQGYAALLYRMMLMAGIDARLISGTGNGGGHAWNIVKLGDYYYNVDSTWDATTTRTALVPISYKYYLRCNANFGDHTRDGKYSTDEFNASYPMNETDYQLSETEASVILLSGTCGDDLTWTVTQGGTLTISGTGAIPDHDSTSDVPWAAARSGITEVVLGEEITGIGIFAFCYFSALPEITLPDSITTIDQYAFGYCTSLTEIIIPSEVTTISYKAFIGCTALTSITFEGEAPSIKSSSFTDVTATANYPSNDSTWTEDVLLDYGGDITWVGYVKHTYGEPEFTWAEDFSTCTAKFTCTDTDCGETYLVDCTVTSETTDATCTEDGETVYTAVAELSNKEYTGTKTVTIATTGHSYDDGMVTTAATCTEDGVLTYTCANCEDTYTETIAATGHNYDDGEVTTAATCTETGVLTYTCASCGDSYTKVIAALGHTEVADAAVAATCTETGLSEGSHCSVCGAVLIAQEVIEATGHSYNEGVVTTEPTCTETGVMTYTCEACGDTYTEEIAATGHAEVADAAVAASCTETGLTAGSHCSVCGEVLTEQKVIDALGHSYDEGVVTTEATCTEDGVRTYTCTVCGDTYSEVIDATGHSYDEGVVTIEATCTEDGVKTYTCAVCGDTYTEAIAATGHSYDEGVVTTVATCTEAGVMSYTCVTCGDTYTDVIAATGHSYDGEVTTEATCTTAGVKTYTCTTCGDSYTEEIVALGHSYAGEVTAAATCTEDGVMTYTCATCGDSYTEEIIATGHTSETDAAVAATCTATGLTAGSHCSVCGEVLTEQKTIAALGHSYDEGVITTAATCTRTGVMTYTCTVCVATYTEAIETTGHTAVTDAAVAATCTATGLTAGSHCSVCGEVLTAQEVIAATGHSYDSGTVTKEATTTEEGVRTYTCETCGTTYTESIEKLADSSSSTDTTGDTDLTGETDATGGTGGSGSTGGNDGASETNPSGASNAASDTGAGASADTGSVPATSLQISRSKIYLKVKGTAKIGVIVAPANTTDEVTYTSSNPSVVKVSASGKITAKKAGTANITVQAGNVTKTITVKVVKKAVKATKLSFKKKKLSVTAGTVQFLSYTVKNSKATTQVKWKSSNSKVVSVDQTGKITAKKKGTATITITANGKKAKCKITVK